MSHDLLSLPPDTFARIAGVVSLLRDLAPAKGRLAVVDVGGHPGLVAQALPEHLVITADIFTTGPRGYVKASGAALPLRDRGVDIAVANDVLEHVPPAARGTVISEMARVSGLAVIVGGPYASRAVELAENSIRRMAPSGSQCARWLGEHRDNGLPNLDDCAGELERSGLTVGVLPGAGVVEWYLLQALAVHGEESVEVAAALRQFASSYNQDDETGTATAGAAYRHVLVGVRQSPLPAGFIPWREADSIDATDTELSRLSAIITMTENLARLFKSAAAGGGSIDAKYLEILEAALAARPQPAAATAVPGQGLLSRMLGRRRP